MNIFKTALCLILSTFIIACSGSRTITTPLTDRNHTVDGTLAGWDVEQSVVERTDAINYYATHDNEFLYLYADVKSPAQNNAMRQSGYIIYISDNQENPKKVGIAFPSGTFNLLRENPAAYNSFLNDQEWFQNPENNEILENLDDEIFDRIMIVEQTDNGEQSHGFINKDQLQIDGIDIAVDEGRRLMGIEMRVPLNQSSLYNLDGSNIWIGFEINPPNFKIQNNEASTTQQQRYGGQGRQSRQCSVSTRANMRRQLGQYEQWYQLNLSN